MKLNLNKVFKTLFLLLLISLSEIRLSKVENDLRVALKNVFYNLKQGSPNQPAGKKVKKNYDVIFEKDTFKGLAPMMNFKSLESARGEQDNVKLLNAEILTNKPYN